ncbi:testis-expressed protein 47 isoform X2 [Microcaecilia unicolor]|uniref:Testis-expressed protein 47-like isoform X2 n=1 Tax=Microcaecilia unicolor TaxID=1415580 RepID=A0A6P7YC23_9AMPH|nr:testis-expressed protein 47-like isoform X2 [Microcaecilia unicolor]
MSRFNSIGEESNKESGSSAKVRRTLFQHIMHKRMTLNTKDDMKSLLHRLILLAKISPELADKRDLTEYWEQLFISLQRYYQGEGVTGLLLLYPSYAIHILESSSDVLYSILRDLKEMKYQGDRVMVMEPRILVLSHNIPNRLFQEWRCNLVDAPDKKTPFHGGPTECIINECITKILKLGMHMHMQAKTATGTSDSIPEKALELLIPQAAICYLLECDELLTPELFLQAYDCPLNIIMDSDLVWPPPVPIKPVEMRP